MARIHTEKGEIELPLTFADAELTKDIATMRDRIEAALGDRGLELCALREGPDKKWFAIFRRKASR